MKVKGREILAKKEGVVCTQLWVVNTGRYRLFGTLMDYKLREGKKLSMIS
jgi:hypothetical protein